MEEGMDEDYYRDVVLPNGYAVTAADRANYGIIGIFGGSSSVESDIKPDYDYPWIDVRCLSTVGISGNPIIKFAEVIFSNENGRRFFMIRNKEFHQIFKEDITINN